MQRYLRNILIVVLFLLYLVEATKCAAHRAKPKLCLQRGECQGGSIVGTQEAVTYDECLAQCNSKDNCKHFTLYEVVIWGYSPNNISSNWRVVSSTIDCVWSMRVVPPSPVSPVLTAFQAMTAARRSETGSAISRDSAMANSSRWHLLSTRMNVIDNVWQNQNVSSTISRRIRMFASSTRTARLWRRLKVAPCPSPAEETVSQQQVFETYKHDVECTDI